MRKQHLLRSAWALAAACGMGMVVAGAGSRSAQAAVIESYVADQAAYTGATGSIVPVSIYLQETLTPGDTSVITATNNSPPGTVGGLTAGGAGVNGTLTVGTASASTPTGSFTPASPLLNLATAYNQGPAGSTNFEFIAGLPLSTTPLQPDANGRILLGVLDVTAGSGVTTYSLTSLHNDTIPQGPNGIGGPSSSGNTVTTDGTDLDVSNNNGYTYTGANDTPGFTFTVTGTSVVPEPASMAVFGLGALGLLARRRRMA